MEIARASQDGMISRTKLSRAATLSRLWYYFRIGYFTYLSFLLGGVNTLVLVWYVLLPQLPFLQSVFPRLALFAIAGVILGIPAGVLVGWLHLKRSPVFASEAELLTEANPYYRKLAPATQKRHMHPYT